MEFESEVFILRKFRRFFILASFLISLAFFSCANYGFYQLVFGEEDVDERFSGFSDLSGETVLSSDLGLNGKYSFIVVTDVHIGESDVHSSKMNDFLDQLESRGIEYETDYEDVGSDNEIAVLVTVSWGD